jgi:hypothetical protein
MYLPIGWINTSANSPESASGTVHSEQRRLKPKGRYWTAINTRARITVIEGDPDHPDTPAHDLYTAGSIST